MGDEIPVPPPITLDDDIDIGSTHSLEKEPEVEFKAFDQISEISAISDLTTEGAEMSKFSAGSIAGMSQIKLDFPDVLPSTQSKSAISSTSLGTVSTIGRLPPSEVGISKQRSIEKTEEFTGLKSTASERVPDFSIHQLPRELNTQQKAQMERMKKLEDRETQSLLNMNYMYVVDQVDEIDSDYDTHREGDSTYEDEGDLFRPIRIDRVRRLLPSKTIIENQDIFIQKEAYDLFVEYDNKGEVIKRGGKDMINVHGVALRDVDELQKALQLLEQRVKGEKKVLGHRTRREFKAPHWWPNLSTPLDSMTRKILLQKEVEQKITYEEIFNVKNYPRLFSKVKKLRFTGRPVRYAESRMNISIDGEGGSSTSDISVPEIDLEQVECLFFTDNDESLSGRTESMRLCQYYLKKHKIYELFQFLISHLLSAGREDPISFLLEFLDKCIMYRAGLGDAPLLFTEKHVEALYHLMDPMQIGVIDPAQYKTGMETLGIDASEHKPEMTADGMIRKEVFISNTMKYLQYILNDMLRKRFIYVDGKMSNANDGQVAESLADIPYRMNMTQVESQSELEQTSKKYWNSFNNATDPFCTTMSTTDDGSRIEDDYEATVEGTPFNVPPTPSPSENFGIIAPIEEIPGDNLLPIIEEDNEHVDSN